MNPITTKMRKPLLIGLTLFFNLSLLLAQKKPIADPVDKLKDQIAKNIDADYDKYKKTALQIWDYAEVGYKEVKSSALLQQLLKDNGFTVQAGVAEIPTAFVATYGTGKPVIGILAEFDALPGLSQEASPDKNTNSRKKCRSWLRTSFVRYGFSSCRH